MEVLGVRKELTTWSDKELIVAVKAGTDNALTLLCERYYGRVLRALTTQTGDSELAADLAQETFMDVARSFHQLRDDQPFDRWVYAIARNNRRSAQRRIRTQHVIPLDWLHGMENVGQMWVDKKDESAGVDERDLQQQVLDNMPERLRIVLLLNLDGGFGVREIAPILGISQDAAKKRLTRAKERFRARYHEFNEEGRK